MSLLGSHVATTGERRPLPSRKSADIAPRANTLERYRVDAANTGKTLYRVMPYDSG